MKNFIFLIALGWFMTIISGCGGSSDGAPDQILPLQKGYVVDSPISGLGYECGSIIGVTNDEGMFECREFPVTFKIGNLIIGSVTKMNADKKIYPQDIIGKPRSNFEDAKVISLTRFLQSLDDDGDIDKVIKITPKAIEIFYTEQKLSELTESDVKILVEDVGKTYVSKDDAIEHLKENIEKLTSITITPTTMTIELGKSATFKAVGSFSNGVKRDISSEITWSSSKPAIASINGSTAKSKAVGTTTIKALYKGISKTAALTVTEASLVSLDINATDTEIAEGTETKLAVMGTFSDDTTSVMTTQVIWSSSNPSKATINATGTVKAMGVGSVIITATKENITTTKAITISDAELVSIELTPAIQNISKGSTSQVTVTGTYTNAQTQTLTNGIDFNSSDMSVATVDSSGIVTALKAGTTTISSKLGLLTSQSTVIVPNQAPVANAGEDQKVYYTDPVTLNALESTDDSLIVDYEWKENDTLLSNEGNFTKTDFSVGTHNLTLKVTDDGGKTSSDSVLVEIFDDFTNLLPMDETGSMKSVSSFSNNGVTTISLGNGSQLFFKITNDTNRNFQITKFEIKSVYNGVTTLRASSVDSSMLSGSEFTANEFINLGYTLSSGQTANYWMGIYYLTDKVTGETFTNSFKWDGVVW